MASDFRPGKLDIQIWKTKSQPILNTCSITSLVLCLDAANKRSYPGTGTTWTDLSGNISVADIFANALADYILFRAFSKDAESAANASRAQAHYALYTTALSTELRGTTSIAPSTSGAPNHG